MTKRPAGDANSRRPTILPHLDAEKIVGIYLQAPGSEVDSGKFDNPESSAALAANTFGLFVEDASVLPALPGLDGGEWRPTSVQLEAIVRLPWSGGRHPCLDALIRTETRLVGVESKRYEPYRGKRLKEHSDAYLRDVWGDNMHRYSRVWTSTEGNQCPYETLDVAQLVKHAFALRTQVHREVDSRRKAILYYLFADPKHWPDGRLVSAKDKSIHLGEIERFASEVKGDEVAFVACSYRSLLELWKQTDSKVLRHHALAVQEWARLE